MCATKWLLKLTYFIHWTKNCSTKLITKIQNKKINQKFMWSRNWCSFGMKCIDTIRLKLWMLFKQFYQLCADKKLWQISQMKTKLHICNAHTSTTTSSILCRFSFDFSTSGSYVAIWGFFCMILDLSLDTFLFRVVF